jgi:hypothetical protein
MYQKKLLGSTERKKTISWYDVSRSIKYTYLYRDFSWNYNFIIIQLSNIISCS